MSHRVVLAPRPGRLHHLPPTCAVCGKPRILPPNGERWIHAPEPRKETPA